VTVPRRGATGQEDLPTRERVLTAAMRLFGSQGYAATTIAQIESAAGLRPGSGGMYRHFSSKRDVLAEGVRAQLGARSDLLAFIADPDALASLPLKNRLEAVAHAALARLRAERDLNRIILRDLDDFPDLLDLVRTTEMQRIQSLLAGWLRAQATPSTELDWNATAVVLMGSVSHFWLLGDAMGTHPSGLDDDQFVEALADLVAGLLSSGPGRRPSGVDA
jgi:AcrR family transcriptional regulator